MIEKFITIKNVGKFINCTAQGDVTLRKVTLLYGENGRGKSTLAAIIRSLRDGNSAPIYAKKTLGRDEEPYIQIKLETRNATFSNQSWDEILQDIEVFDSTFVNGNIFSGDFISSDHRQNLYQLVIGERGVNLAQEIQDLDSQIRQSSNAIRAERENVIKLIKDGLDIEEFLALDEIEDIDAKIEEKRQELQALEKASELLQRNSFHIISLPNVDYEKVLETLSKSIDEISIEAEKKINEHCSQLGSGAEGWVKKGNEWLDNETDTCPFCGQKINDIELVKSYKDYFSQAYQDLKDEIEALTRKIKNDLGQQTITDIQSKINSNETLDEFWKNYLDYDSPNISFDDINHLLGKIKEKLLSLLDQKMTSPLEIINGNDDLEALKIEHNKLLKAIEDLNTNIAAINNKITEKKTNTKAGNLTEEKHNFVVLENTKIRHSENAKEVCQRYRDLQLDNDNLKNEKQTKRSELDSFSDGLLSQYQDNINSYLCKFISGIGIVETKTTHQGGRPKSVYSLSVNGQIVPLGSPDLIDQPSFKNTLSDGEKNALAFAFFLAMLDQDENLAEKIIVIDDPITSLDRERKTCTQQAINLLARRVKQLIVFSHDPHFLHNIWENAHAPKCLYIRRINQSESTIEEWDIKKETQSTYLKNYDELWDFLEMGSSSLYSLVRSIRPVLESYLRLKFPREFEPKDWLGDMIDKIRNADDSHTLANVKANLDELSAINDYSKKFHHSQNPAADAEIIHEAELTSFVRRTLDLHKNL